jgi:hypothetical protein
MGYAAHPTRDNVFSVCVADLEENEDGKLRCPECEG